MRGTRTLTIAATLGVLLLSSGCTGQDASAAPVGTIATTTTTTTTTPLVADAGEPKRAKDLDPQSYIDEYQTADVDLSSPVPIPVSAEAKSASPTIGAGGSTGYQVPGPLDDNVFVDSGDSTFVSCASDAESTFGLDVDTGSYRVARTTLDIATRPDPASIRVEEWVNAFTYGDPGPDGTDLGVVVESGQAPHTTDGTQLMRVGVTTRTIDDASRPPANITFVVDTSGSMDIRERLGTVKASLALLVQHLNDGDTLSIVEYGSEARILLEPTPVQQVDRIVAVIDAMHSEGSTNMEAGLMLGYDQARAAFRPGGLNVVVLASDGVANVGSTDPTVLTEQITKAGQDGIHLVTVGYGMGNYNDFLMEQLADQGDGFYSYVDTLAEARRLFVSDLTPTLTVVAKDAKIQVRFDPAVVDSYRLIGYENRMMDDEQFDNAAADAGELGAGHRVSALYEVRLKAGATPQAAAAEVALRWKSTDGGAQELRRPVTLSTGAVPTATRLAATVAGVAEVLRDNSVVTARGLTLDALLADAQELRAANVNGADELVELILQAKDASRAPAPTTVEGLISGWCCAAGERGAPAPGGRARR